MDHRCAYVLGGLIDEYIQTARPISSSALVRRLRLSVSPATMRSLLQELDDAGYIVQPHTSAGRIPTDKGYRYYVDHIESEEFSQTEQVRLAREFKKLQEQYAELTRAASKLLAQHARIVAISGDSSPSTHIAGLSWVLEQPEALAIDTVRELSAILELMSDERPALSDPEGNMPVTYIGTEIPFFPAQHTSIVIRRVDDRRHQPVILAVIGPKRMLYHHHAALLNALAQLIHKS